MLFTFGKTKTPMFSLCFIVSHETIKHIILEYICVKRLWNHERLSLTNDISLTFGFINDVENNIYKITNHILLIFKLRI